MSAAPAGNPPLMRIALFLAYPVLVHLAVVLQRPWLQCAAVGHGGGGGSGVMDR